MKITDREAKIVLIAVCIGQFITPLASTMMNLALVSIGAEFSVGSHDLALVNTVFLLSSVMLMVPFMKIADIIGLKKTFMFGVILAAASSLCAFFSPSFLFLLAMRATLGIAAACMAVTGMSLVTHLFPANRRGWAIGIAATSVYLGLAAGPTLGGFVTHMFGWRPLFLVIMGISLLALMAVMAMKSEIIQCKDDKLDLKTSVVYAAGIFFLMYGVICLPALWSVALIVLGAVLLVLFIMLTRKSSNPIMDLKIFKYRSFRYAGVAAFLNYAASHAVTFFFALYLQHIGAMSPLEAGMVLLAQPIMQIILTPVSGMLTDRMRNKRILPTMGMAMTAIGVAMMIFLGETCNLSYVIMTLIIIGIGFGLFSAPNTAIVMSAVPPRNRSEASGTLGFFRQTGMMVSMGIAMCCISVILGSMDMLTPDRFGAFVHVISIASIICFVMCVVGTALSWLAGNGDAGDSGIPKESTLK